MVKIPRRPRQQSETGIYHVMLRGTNRQSIFHDDSDRIRFLETLKRYKAGNAYLVLGWCLMGNHVHLLLREGERDLADSMKRIGVSYVWHYNRKYNAVGHLFQDRYKSEAIESDPYLLTVIRYIHQNPVKARIVKRPFEWKWSSCIGYYGENDYPSQLLDRDLILGMFSKEDDKAVEWFKQFNEAENTDICLGDTVDLPLTDEKALEEIKKLIAPLSIAEIKSMGKEQRNELLTKIKKIRGITHRQTARVTGVSPSLVFKAK